jgi:CarD family transcriptional regulator
MFHVNERVVYPGHGIAVIENTVERRIGGKEAKFLKLRFLFKEMSVFVPIDNVERMSIRVLSSKEEIQISIDELAKPSGKNGASCFDFSPSGWNRRQKFYQEKIGSGDLLAIAKVYKDLMVVSQLKELSFGEKGILQMAEDLLSQEISMVSGDDLDFILKEIRSPFRRYVAFSSSGEKKSERECGNKSNSPNSGQQQMQTE